MRVCDHSQEDKLRAVMVHESCPVCLANTAGQLDIDRAELIRASKLVLNAWSRSNPLSGPLAELRRAIMRAEKPVSRGAPRG